MKIFSWEQFKKWRGVLLTDQPDPAQQAERIVAMQRDVVLPSKAGVFLVVFFFLFSRGWFDEPSTQSVVHDTFKVYFLVYLLCNCVGAVCFISWRRLPWGLFQWLAFTLGLLDGLFMAGMTIVTGGFSSITFWVFPALIVLNALSIPLAMPQFVLNLLLSVFYVVAVITTPPLNQNETVLAGVPGHSATGVHGTNQIHRPAGESPARTNKFTLPKNLDNDNPEDEIVTEQLLLRVSVLWLLTLCCYGAQVLLERQRQAVQEAVEFAAREGQLQSAGRLAAEFAHQIKNPLAVISNAAYSLQRSLRENKNSAAQQIEIIQEEVARADKVITQIMGYAQLSEGRVEKLNLVEEMEQAIEQVFPGAVPTGVKVKKKFTGPFPPLLMQRGHLNEILVNLLLNAREALNGRGQVVITAEADRKHAVEIAVTDDGPGIAPDKIGRVFEAYFTTKEKGTGLGLAIVRHNVELYGGTVRVDSVLGKGAKFTVIFPAKVQPRPFVK
jgi:signal transduction histidine kinase